MPLTIRITNYCRPRRNLAAWSSKPHGAGRTSDCRRPRRAALVGSTPVMQLLRERVERVAVTDFTVLIEGESGTGKELVARQLHEISRRRRHGPFVAVNCAAVVETLLEAEFFGIEERTATGVRGRRGKFEHADGGTLFLDEVSDLSLSAQAKLLRALQDLSIERVGGTGAKRVNTRIVVATNRPLGGFGRAGAVSGRPVLSAQRRGDSCAGVAPASGGHSGACQVFSRPSSWLARSDPVRRCGRRPSPLRMAGQRTGARATDGTRRGADGLRPRRAGRSATARSRRLRNRNRAALTEGDSLRAWGSRYVRLVFERCGRNKRRTCRALDISYHTLQAYLRYADRKTRMSATQLPGWVTSLSRRRCTARSGA